MEFQVLQFQTVAHISQEISQMSQEALSPPERTCSGSVSPPVSQCFQNKPAPAGVPPAT